MKLTLLSKIGDGGFGDVWKAKDELGRFVAVKMVREAGAAVSSALDHARALARTKHQNVVSVLSLETIRDPDTKKQVDAIVMELVEGTTLTRRLSGPKFSISEARKIGKSIANGIGHIHEQGMEHGDLHSDNVMVTEGGAKVIDILYRDSLAMLSSGSREARLRRDRTNLRLLLQQIIVHSELGAEEATEFNNMIDDTASATQIKDSFLKIVSAANHSDRVRLLDHAYGRVIDGGFAEGDAYAEALLGETPIGVTLPLLKRIVEEKSYQTKHRAYLRLLWNRLTKPQRQSLLGDLGSALDGQLPSGEWWPLLKMVTGLRREGWDGLAPVVRLRLENLIIKDVLAGHVNIHQSFTLSSNGSLGTYATQLWPYFTKLEALVENLISLLHQNWFTQNYVGKYFLPVLPRIAEEAGKTEELIGALGVAVRNDAKLIVNSLQQLPDDWVRRLRQAD